MLKSLFAIVLIIALLIVLGSTGLSLIGGIFGLIAGIFGAIIGIFAGIIGAVIGIVAVLFTSLLPLIIIGLAIFGFFKIVRA